ncbi:DUF4214 domain-containing protein [Pseudomonas sp. 21LCFQ010]|uniref:DUF4214 domain-containing protein n=1 Tax=Pseudomonas sp. 21LCFQ010 TaxID=2957506 RepID=UPI002096CA26|nr:DUF4214 domain-containing protein [Pseudomonas sp. 21LCFQ010]
MATITYHQPFAPSFLDSFDNVVVTGVTSSSIVASDGPYSVAINGFFSSSGYGRVSSATYFLDNVPYLTFSGLSASITSTNFNALFNAFNGSDRFVGSWGNDTFFVTPGNDDFYGGAGLDTIMVDANRSYVTVAASGSGYMLKAPYKTDTMNGIERLTFFDGTLALDVKAGETTGSVYRLYQAAFDRKPDTGGLKYWVSKVDQGTSMAEVALGFVQSNEFRQLNPSGDTPSMLNNYYKNVLHRAPDATGLAYWTNAAANGQSSHQILMAFAESNENMANTSAATKDGIWLG